MNPNYNYYQQNQSQSMKSLIDILYKIENKFNFDFTFFKDKVKIDFYKSVKAFQDEFILYMNKIINNSNVDMKKTLNDLINYEVSLIQQNLEQLKEFNPKYDERIYSSHNNMNYQQIHNMNQLPINNVNNTNQIYGNNEQINVQKNKNIPNIPSIGKILPLANVNPINQNDNNNNYSKKTYKTASYTKYGPFTSFGPIYDLSESSLSTFEISTIEPYLYNINEQRNDKNNVNKELNKSNENSIVNDVKDEYIEINNNEIKDWEKMGIDVESICQNLNINYKKNNENSYENVKSYDERISEISQLLKQLYEIQEERKKRNYYQTEISVDEKELALKIESELNKLIKNIPPSQLISKSNIQYAMNNIQHYEPWYQGVLTFDNGSSTNSQSSINRYNRN